MDEINNITRYQQDIERLMTQGDELMMGLANELKDDFSSDYKKLSKEMKERIAQYSFIDKYHEWYNESLAIIKQLIPDRLEDFMNYYKLPKRKEITYGTYTISDYMLGLQVTRGSEVVVARSSVVKKFTQQYYIVKSLKGRFNSSLYDLKQLLQADIFDSELDSAIELCKKGFFRASGAVCGVVIEKHLHQVATSHNIEVAKKHPTINDYNDLLKNNNVIDIPTFRKIQLMGDLRNLCDHNKEIEPKKRRY